MARWAELYCQRSVCPASRKASAPAAHAGAVDPHSDSHADAAYRRDAIAALTRRTVRRAAERCG